MTQWDQMISASRLMIREPRRAARDLADLSMPRNVIMVAFLAVMVISVIVTEPLLAITATMVPGEPLSPFVRAIGSTLGGIAIVWVIWRVGTLLGGTGNFNDIFVGFVVLEALFVAGIGVLLLLMTVMPALAGLVGFGFICYWLWMFSNALAELHGYPSAWKAFGVVAVSWIIVNYASILIMGLFSGGASNV